MKEDDVSVCIYINENPFKGALPAAAVGCKLKFDKEKGKYVAFDEHEKEYADSHMGAICKWLTSKLT